jgi:hypothetical protein
MVTIKSIIEAYKIMFRYWWWLIGLMVIWYFISPKLCIVHGVDIASRWSYQLLFFATCLATRPSIMRKDWEYFRSQIIYFGYIAAYLLIAPVWLWPVLSPLSIFFILFFLDSAHGPRNFFLSMWYSLKMIIFNYPLLVVMIICFNVPVIIINKVFFPTSMTLNMLAALLLPIGVCTYANIYIKKLHDQFDLYFKQA